MKLVIVRHGDPDYTIDSLTEKGWREARYLAQKLSKLEIKDFYVSPLGRAKDTASCTLKKMNRTATECDWLQEYDELIGRPDEADYKIITWDWLPQDWTDGENAADRSAADLAQQYARGLLHKSGQYIYPILTSEKQQEFISQQYDMTGGTGLYLQGGAWEQITWTKEDATGPFALTDADGAPLTVAPGKSFIAIWGGYYGQGLTLTAADGSEQTLPEKPVLLESGVSDEAAAAAEEELSAAQRIIDAQAAADQAKADLADALDELQEAQAACDADSENADLLAARDAVQAKIDELNQTIADNQAILDAAAPEETPAPEEEQPAESESENPAE